MTTTYPILKDPEFIDLQKTTVRVKLVNENGTESIAQLKVPADQARGVNQIWDRILDEFDVEVMRKARNDLEVRRRKEAEFQDKKRKASIQSDILRQLFDKKMSVFNFPFMTDAAKEDKAAIRRAPNDILLMAVATSIVQKYLQENNMTFVDLFDLIDDAEYEAQVKAQAEQSAEQVPLVEPTSVADVELSQDEATGESV